MKVRHYGLGSISALCGIVSACSADSPANPSTPSPPAECLLGSSCNPVYKGEPKAPDPPPFDASGGLCTVGLARQCLMYGQYDVWPKKRVGGDDTCPVPSPSREWITSSGSPCPYNDLGRTAVGATCATVTDIANCTSTITCASVEGGVTTTTVNTFSGTTLHQTLSTKRASDAGAMAPDCIIDVDFQRL